MSIEDIKLVDAKDVRVGRGGGGLKNKGKTYENYAIALKNIIPILKDELEEKDVIRVKSKDIIQKMGGNFALKSPTALLWGIRYILFKEGIFVTLGRHKDGDDIYVLKKVVIGDKLPDALSVKLTKELEKDS